VRPDGWVAGEEPSGSTDLGMGRRSLDGATAVIARAVETAPGRVSKRCPAVAGVPQRSPSSGWIRAWTVRAVESASRRI